MFQHVMKNASKVSLLVLATAASLSAQQWKVQDSNFAPLPNNQSLYGSQYCEDDYGFGFDQISVGVDYLNWKANVDNTAFAYRINRTATEIDPNNVTIVGKQKPEEFHFKNKPGIRVNLGYQLPGDNWTTNLTWTHLVSHRSGSASAPNALDNTVLPGTGFSSESFLPCNKVRSTSRLSFNDYTLSLGREYGLSECFSMRPYVGLKYLQIKQNLRGRAESTTGQLTGSINAKDQTRYFAFGLQGGFDAQWQLGYGYALYSNFGGGIVYGKAHTQLKSERIVTEAAATSTANVKEYNTQRVARPNLDFALGLSWNYCFWECYLVSLKAGWEYHHYFNQNFFYDASSATKRHGDLSLHGFVFGADVSF